MMQGTENVKPLTEAQQKHLRAINAAFMQAKQRMDEFIAYLRAEHDAPAGEWGLQNIEVGFERRAEVENAPAEKTRVA